MELINQRGTILEVIYYTLVAAGLYFMSDWLLDRMEISRGGRFKNRSIVFFIIILVLAFLTFGLINYLVLSPD
jgi:hypothetical protein